ncbi:FAD-linked oxidase C-terminal domain-containing protein [Nocardia niigatensis]
MVLDQFTVDETGRAGQRPRGVVYPVTTEDVVTVVDWARGQRTPLIARGAGTSLEWHLLSRGDELIRGSRGPWTPRSGWEPNSGSASRSRGIGDGNVHTIVPYTEAEYQAAQQFSDLVVRHGLEVGGTAIGDRGIGLARKKYLRGEHRAAVDLMVAVKRALDPHGMFNPGKVLDFSPGDPVPHGE